MEEAKQILKNIKNKGHRYSLARETILDLVIKNNKPLSYFDLQKLLSKKKLLVNKTTVYRELKFLKEQKVIKELQFNDGIKYYEITPKEHHHHIVCNECETIDHIELKKDLEETEKQIAKNNNFKVFDHSLEFYGLCQKCQLSAK